MNTHPIIVLVLDDDVGRHAAFIQNNPNCRVDSAYTCAEAFDLLMNNHYDVICFDHDLGEGSGGEYITSLPFARAVRQQIDDGGVLDSTLLVVHSANPVGAQDILSLFARTQNHTFKVPWAWTMKNLFKLISN
jgi:hypothetical protein